MAEGIVQPRGDIWLEVIRVGYFDELFMRSFFELSYCRPSNETYAQAYPLVPPHYQTFYYLSKELDIRSFFDSSNKSSETSSQLESSSNTGSGFVMHDLIHDLAKFVSGGIHCNRESDKPSDVLTTTRHLSYHLRNGNIEIFVHHAIPILVSATSYKLSQLLTKLPQDMSKLVNLRHPPGPWDSYEMPLGVGNLTGLQTLSIFFVGQKNICDLRNLSQLHGTLEISNLENIGSNGTEAMAANLNNKPHLLGLRLRWSHYESDNSFPDLGRDEKMEEDVLDQLQPHTNPEALLIENYGGMKFPSWIKDPSFSNLETVSLIDCRKCRFLPHLMQLPLLKHQVIYGCSAIKIVGSDIYGLSSANKEFLSLEILRFEKMEEWEEWPKVEENEGKEYKEQFPCLPQLVIINCPKLRMFSDHCFPNLVELVVATCDVLRELPRFFPLLQELRIRECPKLVVLPFLQKIESLHLEDCDQITTLSSSSQSSSSSSARRVHDSFFSLLQLETGLPITLQELKIVNCMNLQSLPMGLFDNLTSVQVLELRGYRNLKSLPEGLHKLTSLQRLKITECPAFESFPDMGLPIALRYLSISNCGKLNTLPKGLHKLTNLYLEILECSFLMDCKNQAPLLYWGLRDLTSLSSLAIGGCPALVSIPKGLLHTNLADLCIKNCPILESLHDGLCDLTSLKRLETQNCPMLTQRYQKKEGEEWSKIAKIPEENDKRACMHDATDMQYRL
ncbi:putative disease resistance protein At3g14460 [Telopea speciosissima]|uniref:putative disease resistance protein At3g14460 n=1 Tax=Telopea speciosissima TaxID=54955 RepID=UPI001CC80B46|nr:putative disease resistance protein At3g14460 [Telopea speciosissima]